VIRITTQKPQGMKGVKIIFKIVVVEDNSFYNNVLTRQLKNYTDAIAQDKDVEFEIQSYTSAADFVRNLKEDIDVVFLDYYLGNGVNGLYIIKQIKKLCKDCKIIIISQSQSLNAGVLTLNEGAHDYIYKDKNALSKSCLIMEEIVNEKLRSNT